jgi:quercetin dioxygenase-like cupin family protein
MYLSAPTEVRASVYLLCPDGYFGDFHPAPRRQIMTLLQGELEVGTSDGEKRRFLPGGSVLVEDITGTGHSTRAIGDAVLIVTQL